MLVPSPITAPSSTTADGWIFTDEDIVLQLCSSNGTSGLLRHDVPRNDDTRDNDMYVLWTIEVSKYYRYPVLIDAGLASVKHFQDLYAGLGIG